MKVKLLKANTAFQYDDYGNTTSPRIETESGWEEISMDDYNTIRCWIQDKGYSRKESYHYILLEESKIQIQECIKEQMEKERAHRERLEKESAQRREAEEKKKLLSKQRKLEKLQKELAALQKNEC